MAKIRPRSSYTMQSAPVYVWTINGANVRCIYNYWSKATVLINILVYLVIQISVLLSPTVTVHTYIYIEPRFILYQMNLWHRFPEWRYPTHWGQSIALTTRPSTATFTETWLPYHFTWKGILHRTVSVHDNTTSKKVLPCFPCSGISDHTSENFIRVSY